jgi:hypothetical protein
MRARARSAVVRHHANGRRRLFERRIAADGSVPSAMQATSPEDTRMTDQATSTTLLAIAVAALALGATSPAAAQPAELSEAELFFELNDTDEDLGIHASIDGGPYVRLTIENPRETKIFSLKASGQLFHQGVTQLFFESAEPSFDELSPQKFFRRFPEGTYEIEAVTKAGDEIEAEAVLSHVMAAPAEGITVAGIPAAENCDAPNLPSVSAPVLIDWEPVTSSHPEVGKAGPVEIVRYQFFVEREGVKLSVDLPPTVTEFEVPGAILALGDEFKFEIIARTATGNNTAVENCFVLE